MFKVLNTFNNEYLLNDIKFKLSTIYKLRPIIKN
jgi:hypothetical protein